MREKYIYKIKNLKRKVDLIDVTTLNSIAKKYMLKNKIDV